MTSDKFNIFFFKPVLLNEETVGELNELTKTYPWCQLIWVLYAKNLKQIQSSEYEKVVKEATIRVSNRKLFFNFLNSQENLPRENFDAENSALLSNTNDNSKDPSYSLIDRFLSSNSGSLKRNSPGNILEENNNYKNVIEKSTTEDDELITETLANIYLQQKNYEKAIHAFEKLRLKYPGKSVYFATRIKEAEDLKSIN